MRETLRADTPLCDWCERGFHEGCQRSGRACPCYCREPSFLNHYSLTNPVTCWLIGKAPEIVAAGPSSLYSHDRPPRCPRVVDEVAGTKCGEAMKLRPGWWKCFMHGDEPEVIRVRPDYSPTLEGDVLALLADLVESESP